MRAWKLGIDPIELNESFAVDLKIPGDLKMVRIGCEVTSSLLLEEGIIVLGIGNRVAKGILPATYQRHSLSG